jgi:hypothetical protein
MAKVLVLVFYDRAFDENIMEALSGLGVKEFSKWPDTLGAGTHEPHLGDQVWPGLNNTLAVVTEEAVKEEIFRAVRRLQRDYPVIALRAFSLPVLDMV